MSTATRSPLGIEHHGQAAETTSALYDAAQSPCRESPVLHHGVVLTTVVWRRTVEPSKLHMRRSLDGAEIKQDLNYYEVACMITYWHVQM